jgi:hypothetical protein
MLHSNFLDDGCDTWVWREVEATRQYIDAAQSVFNDLREVAGQLATVVLFAECRLIGAGDNPLMLTAEQRWFIAQDRSASLRPSPLSAHHHRHLVLAVARFGETIAVLRRLRPSVNGCEEALRTLSGAWREMLHTSHALPGFDTVDLSQSCCGCVNSQQIRTA